jgi:hypothetical protein
MQAMEETVQRERDAPSDAETKLEGLREDHDVAAGSIPARSAAFATAWQTVDPPWTRILASPRYLRWMSRAKSRCVWTTGAGT